MSKRSERRALRARIVIGAVLLGCGLGLLGAASTASNASAQGDICCYYGGEYYWVEDVWTCNAAHGTVVDPSLCGGDDDD